MKRLLTVAAAAIVSIPALAGPVQKGLYEVQGGFAWDVAYEGNDKFIPVMAGLGYYLTDNVEAGGFMSFTKKDEDSYWGVSDVWGLGVFCAYNFVGNGSGVPYIGVAARLLDGGGDVVLIGDLFLGMKAFVMPTLALFGQVDISAASEEIYDFERDWQSKDSTDGDGEPIGVGISGGVRIVLW
jgi:hypothetical protein